jgi:hypothetical protein
MKAKKPDIEFRRQIKVGTYRTYGHIYFRPLVVHLFGKTIIGGKHLKGTLNTHLTMSSYE